MTRTFSRVLAVGFAAALYGWIGLPTMRAWTTRLATIARAAAKTAVFLLKVYRMLPSRPLDRVTPRPVVERFRVRPRGPVRSDMRDGMIQDAP